MLKQLVEAGVRFRNTPIVDDDFGTMRDRFDSLLRQAEASLKFAGADRSTKMSKQQKAMIEQGMVSFVGAAASLSCFPNKGEAVDKYLARSMERLAPYERLMEEIDAISDFGQGAALMKKLMAACLELLDHPE